MLLLTGVSSEVERALTAPSPLRPQQSIVNVKGLAVGAPVRGPARVL